MLEGMVLFGGLFGEESGAGVLWGFEVGVMEN